MFFSDYSSCKKGEIDPRTGTHGALFARLDECVQNILRSVEAIKWYPRRHKFSGDVSLGEFPNPSPQAC